MNGLYSWTIPTRLEVKDVDLGMMKRKRLTGEEEFHDAGKAIGFTVRDFWSWSTSDLLSNATRGILAEYIVGRALGAPLDVRDEWGAYDLKTCDGVRIEVKSAAYLQSWFQNDLSTITFNCAKHRYWESEKNERVGEPGRFSDVYVFALLAHLDKKTVNPLDLSQWEFYTVPTAWLDARKRSQHSITLASLKKSFPRIFFPELAEAVQAAAEMHRKMLIGGET